LTSLDAPSKPPASNSSTKTAAVQVCAFVNRGKASHENDFAGCSDFAKPQVGNRGGGELFDNWCDPVEGTAFRGGKNASMKPEKSASVWK
jgi:hypothetical protein